MSKYFLLCFILFTLLTSSIPVVIGDSPPTTIYLVTDGDTYKKFGFEDFGIYYTPESLTSFHMPFIVPKEGNKLKKNDLKGSITDSSENWNKKNPKFEYDIIASNDNYYVVDYSMQLKASTDSFTVDFIPEIKSKKFTQFAYWNSSWDKRGQIHINSSQVDNDLVNFPVFFNFTNNMSFYSFCQSDLDDIRFVSSDNVTEYYHEIEDYSFNDYGDTVNLSVWVNVTDLDSDADTYVNVYYHNFNANEQGMNTSVWDSDYEVVYHMYNNTYTSVDDTSDSTVNDNYGNNRGDGPHHIAGDNSPAVDFTSDSIRTSSSVFSGSAVDMTVECYFKADEVPTGLGDILLTNDDTDGSYTLLLTLEDSKVKFNYRDGGDNFAGTSFGFTNTTDYHYLAGVCDENVGTELYMDGDFKNSQSYGSFKDYSPVWSIGSRSALDRYYNGKIDELRISSTVRNNSWLNTSYNNLNNMSNGEFYFISSSVEEGPSSPPVNIYANTTGDTSINLSWDKGTNYDYTYIERNTVTSWDRTEGTDIYKNTGTSFTDTVSKGNLYYYKFWGYNITSDAYSNPSSVVSNLTGPSNPSNVDGSLDGTIMNITWTVASFGADKSVVISKLDSHPTGPSDGTEEYNGTSDGVNISGQTTSHYYSVFSFNETVNRYSSGIDLNYGTITINCYNESSSNEIHNWSVRIESTTGSSSFYYNNSVNNSLIISSNDIPVGLIVIIINATDYYQRLYYYTISANSHYVVDTYLVHKDNEDVELKAINVLGPQSEYGNSPTVEDAYVNISTYINNTVGWKSISRLYTDANGQCFLYLENDKLYKVNISKTDYDNELSEITTNENIDSYTFRIFELSYTGPTYTSFFDTVTFTVTLSGNYMELGNATITFNDENNSMINTDIYLYEYYAGTSTLINHSHNTSNSFSYRVGNINTSRDHYTILYFNSTSDYYDASPIDRVIWALYIYHGLEDKFSFDTRTKGVFGPFTINGFDAGWHTLISIIIAIFVLVLLGPYNSSLGIIGAGVSLAFTEGLFNLLFTDDFPVLLVSLVPILIIIGILLYMSSNRQGGV